MYTEANPFLANEFINELKSSVSISNNDFQRAIINTIKRYFLDNDVPDVFLIDLRSDESQQKTGIDNHADHPAEIVYLSAYMESTWPGHGVQNNIDVVIPRLTKRETEVLTLIAKGLTYSEISETLEMSLHTVTSHVKNLYRKLQVNSRGEATFEAMQLGLVSIN